MAVLAHADIDVGGVGFDGILGKIEEYLAQHVAVGFQRGILGERNVPGDVGIERLDAFQERGKREGFYDGSLELGELAVTIYKVGELLAGVVNRLNAFLVFASLDLRGAEVSLADAGDGSRGVHDFVGEHAGQLLPGFHFVPGNEAGNVALHVVECLLQGSFTGQQA